MYTADSARSCEQVDVVGVSVCACQELTVIRALPVSVPASIAPIVAGNVVECEPPEGAYPHLTEFTAGHVLQPGYDFRSESSSVSI